MVAYLALSEAARGVVRLLFLDGPALSTDVSSTTRRDLLSRDVITEVQGWVFLTRRGAESAINAGLGIEKADRAANYVWVPR